MRTKRDPGVRQEAFIRAATELFMEKGFESVSVRDVLDAVADNTASPSVFYYYFPSKDALYRACVSTVAQNYLAAIRKGFSMEGKSLEEWLLSLVSCMEKYLLNERNLILTGNSTPNRLFVLDMREEVTAQICSLWEGSLLTAFAIPPEDVKGLAQFLSGGISEMMFALMLENVPDQRSVQDLAESVVRFCMNTIGIPDPQKARLLDTLKNAHKNNDQER